MGEEAGKLGLTGDHAREPERRGIVELAEGRVLTARGEERFAMARETREKRRSLERAMQGCRHSALSPRTRASKWARTSVRTAVQSSRKWLRACFASGSS